MTFIGAISINIGLIRNQLPSAIAQIVNTMAKIMTILFANYTIDISPTIGFVKTLNQSPPNKHAPLWTNSVRNRKGGNYERN